MRTALVAMLIVVLGATETSSQCLKYEPTPVTLEGTVIVRTFPGPPEYASVAQGDKPEKAALLLLDEPICVDGDDKPDSVNGESESDVILVHIAPVGGSIDNSLIDKRVVVTGTLFHAITGHHRTKVLIHAKSIGLDKPNR